MATGDEIIVNMIHAGAENEISRDNSSPPYKILFLHVMGKYFICLSFCLCDVIKNIKEDIEDTMT